jgi:hypothetical protein
VFFSEFPVPFADRADYLLETDLGILCQARNLETQVAARTRLLDFIWAERPILINEGDEWSETIRRHNFGSVLETNDVPTWTQAMLHLASSPRERSVMSANIAKAKERFSWARCVEPIYQYVLRQRPLPVPLPAAIEQAA